MLATLLRDCGVTEVTVVWAAHLLSTNMCVCVCLLTCPACVSGGVADSPTRLQLRLLPEGEGGPALDLYGAVAALRAADPDGPTLLKVKRALGVGWRAGCSVDWRGLLAWETARRGRGAAQPHMRWAPCL